MQLTTSQRRARAKAIVAEAARSGDGIIEAIRTVNQRMIAVAAQPTAGRAAKGAKKARKAARRAARETAMTRAVRESVAKTLAARAAAPPAKPARPVAEQLAELSDDGLAYVADAVRESGESPYWRPAARHAGSVTESAADTSPPEAPKPLHRMSQDELEAHTAAVLAQHAAAVGFASPSWAAVA